MAARGAEGDITGLSAMHPQVDTPSEQDWAELLQQFVNKYGMQKQRCNVVLSAQDYQLMLVERPDVPDEELRQAVKWKVKDLISAPLDSVVVDIFELPEDANKAGKRMLYAVITDLAKVQSAIDMVADAGLQLEHIDIEVLALRNLTLLKELQRGAAVVRLRPNSGEVSIYRDGNLYLSRHFKLDYNGGLLDDLPTDALALEVQRSFDYFERQMGQVPPGVLYLCGEGIGPEKLTEDLSRSSPVPVEFLDLSSDIGLEVDQVDESILQLCVAAVGAAYRGEQA